MKILFDQGTPEPLRRDLIEHSVSTAYEMGWSDLENGDLLRQAETAFDLIVTTDKNLMYQQNLKTRKIAILVLSTTNWPRIERHKHLVVAAVESMARAAFVELQIPLKTYPLTMHTPSAIHRPGRARFYPATREFPATV